jgi:hypothetical protein
LIRGNVDRLLSSGLFTSAEIEAQQDALARARENLSDLSVTYASRHPRIIDAKGDVDEIVGQIRRLSRTPLRQAQINLLQSTAALESLKAQQVVPQITAQSNPQRNSRGRVLQAKVDNARNDLAGAKARGLEINEPVQTEPVRLAVASPPSVPPDQQHSGTATLFLWGGLFGALLGLFPLTGSLPTGNRVRSIGALEAATSVPVLAHVSASPPQAMLTPDARWRAPRLFGTSGNRTRNGNLERLYSQLHSGEGREILLVLSCDPFLSTSQISANLAALAVHHDHRCLVIDAQPAELTIGRLDLLQVPEAGTPSAVLATGLDVPSFNLGPSDDLTTDLKRIDGQLLSPGWLNQESADYDTIVIDGGSLASLGQLAQFVAVSKTLLVVGEGISKFSDLDAAISNIAEISDGAAGIIYVSGQIPPGSATLTAEYLPMRDKGSIGPNER